MWNKVGSCLLLAWFVLGGRIFVTEAADQMTKGLLALIILLIAGQIAVHVWRLRSRIRAPEVPQA